MSDAIYLILAVAPWVIVAALGAFVIRRRTRK